MNQKNQTRYPVDQNVQQVVRETEFYPPAGNRTKTNDYRFGHDEIAQMAREYEG